ncbi:DMT family transporter [Cytobacillus sp. Hz8]|uniref:DMT family transporter n=1 Tax=Cytobacillus sp. Hz8 TaxID=3347168 RepID=UPI0035E3679E
MHKFPGIIYIIISAIFFGFMPIWVKLAYSTGLTAYDVTFLRSGMAAAMLGIFIRCRKINFHVKRQQIVPLLLSSTLGYTATILTLYLSYNYVSAGVATALHYLFPVLVMLLAYFIYHEKLHFYKWLALLTSLGGIYLIADPDGNNFSLRGVGLAISSAVFFAVYVLSINHPQLKKMDSFVLAFYACLIASITSLVLLATRGNWLLALTLKGLYYTGLVSFFCTALALILFIKGVQRIGSANASILSTLEPVISMAAGIIVLYEPLTWSSLLGCTLIIGAVIMIGYSDLREDSSARDRTKRYCKNN